MRVSQLTIYPVKSTHGHPVDSAPVEPWGLAGDRRWMAVDAKGSAVTARRFPRLLHVTATPDAPGQLRLHGPHAEPIDVDATKAPAEPLVDVDVFRDELSATHPSADADAWLSSLLDHDVRLVWLDDPRRRAVEPQHAQPDDRVSFADGFPLLLATTSSLDQLNRWIESDARQRGEIVEPLPMRRFRPNVVVENDTPFAEDTWSRIRLGDIEFRVAKPCGRCVLTTIDPDSLVKGKEPLRTLSRYRRWDGEVWFGVNLIPETPGELRVGDLAEVAAESTPDRRRSR
ncbi:MOSC domain-containing protein [Actinobacteria bacterium YIM 96077]|uniref:MOSC domain-containing protein n=1 Tax=Phytoactinopolyspora halophila TaxID=1981511 RepID=A0A329QLM0_9ACTN|nr:MOSC N-terminal beta barrel domain-containing protein [Phytoactinopolyspora halophila]AYY12976.1 MOSC domain-containing protein [Actinobacteria bacterium YIM 96077]RAW13240.1 MOSC domain-containing protein [Phytoactinopolyspora halophila]